MGAAFNRHAVLFLLVAVTACVSIAISRAAGPLATVWLANAAMVGFWIRLRPARPWLDLIVFAAAVLLANLLAGAGLSFSLALTGANLGEVAMAILVLSLLQKWSEGKSVLQRTVLALCVAGLLAPLAGAVLGTLVLWSTLGGDPVLYAWSWFAGSMLGAMTVLPIALTAHRGLVERGRMPRLVAMVALALILTVGVCASAIHVMRFPFVAVALPVLLSAALFSPFMTAIIGAAATATVLWNTHLFSDGVPHLSLVLSINTSAALAIMPPFLFAVLRAQLQQSEARLAASERLFRTAMANSAIGMAIVTQEGKLASVNARFGEYLGYSAEELQKLDFRDITHPDDLAGDEALVGALVSGQRDQYEIEKRYIRRDGTPVWGLLAVSILRDMDADGRSFFVAQVVDIDRRKLSEAALQEVNHQLFDEKERLRITLYSIGDAVITTDRWARVIFMNPVAERLTRWKQADAEGKPLTEVFRVVLESTGETVPNPVEECLRRGQPFYLQDGAALVAKDGTLISIQDSAAPVRSPDGTVHGAVLIFQDVTTTRSLQRELLYSAMHDLLTDLPNRRSFERSLTTACTEAGGRVIRHAVGYVDLDRFKLINDTSGHAAGDAALRDVARLIKSLLRRDDIVARLGGDEFGLILFDCSVEQARTIGEKIILGLRSSGFRWQERAYELGASLGFTELSGARRDASELLMEADVACYAAKAAGRNRVMIYEGHASEPTRHRQDMDVATRLKTALEQGRFRLYAQEIVRLAPGGAARKYYEIFIRLLGENGQIIGPADFIPAAERYNLMGTIDRWVISTVCERYGEVLARNPDIHFSINISTDSLDDETLWSFVEATMTATGTPPRQINFEITETAIMSNIGSAISFVSQAQSFGTRIALDDFGVGMSSFAYLKIFNVDTIKIDASFVRDVEQVEGDRKIIQAIVGLAESFGIETVAEGVENDGQLRHIEALGVTMGQGYLWERPRPLDVALGLDSTAYRHG